jgi:hypothetical protein
MVGPTGVAYPTCFGYVYCVVAFTTAVRPSELRSDLARELGSHPTKYPKGYGIFSLLRESQSLILFGGVLFCLGGVARLSHLS